MNKTPTTRRAQVSKDIHAVEVGGWPSFVTPLLELSRPIDQGGECVSNFPITPYQLPPHAKERAQEILATLVRAVRGKVWSNLDACPRSMCCTTIGIELCGYGGVRRVVLC